MRSSVVFAVIALVATIYGQDDDELQCPGGVCVAKALCPNGTYNPAETLAQTVGLVSIRFGLTIDDVDDCLDYQLVCCKTKVAIEATLATDSSEIEPPAPSETYGATCGKHNENGLFYELQSNETVAQYGEFPWVVYMFTSNKAATSEALFVAGGTLIHQKIVLTTAHNVHNKNDLVARFGEWDIGTNKEPIPHQDIRVFDTRIHPSYVLNPIENDLALLVLEAEVKYDKHIQPICLPLQGDIFDGQRCISNGWGTVQGTYAKIMKKLTLPVIPRATCQRMLRFAGLGPYFRLREGFMCAGGENNVDTCKGDGGSPLACQQDDGSFVLAGIVSWGIECGGYNRPGVYVAVSSYMTWINDQMNRLDNLDEID